jgi:hypothetical protein
MPAFSRAARAWQGVGAWLTAAARFLDSTSFVSLAGRYSSVALASAGIHPAKWDME